MSPRFLLVIEAIGPGDSIRQLRRVLKRLLRAYGLRCIRVEELKE